MKKLFSVLAWSLIIGTFCFAGSAMAGDAGESEHWTVIFDKVTEVFQNSRKLIFIIGGFGLIGLAFAAIFGKVNWKWFAGLCVGLGIVAIAGLIVDYVTQNDAGERGVVRDAGEDLSTTMAGYDNYIGQ